MEPIAIDVTAVLQDKRRLTSLAFIRSSLTVSRRPAVNASWQSLCQPMGPVPSSEFNEIGIRPVSPFETPTVSCHDSREPGCNCSILALPLIILRSPADERLRALDLADDVPISEIEVGGWDWPRIR